MKNYPTETYGVSFVLQVPETIEEYAQIHGNSDALLANGVAQDVNHVILAKIRAGLADKIEEAGVPIPTTTNEKGKTIREKVKKEWFVSAMATLGWDAAKRSTVVQEIADEIGYDISSTRGSGPTQKDLGEAESLITMIKAGRSTFDRVKSNLEGRNPGLTLELDDETGEFSAEELARGLSFERRRIEAERRAKQDALL